MANEDEIKAKKAAKAKKERERYHKAKAAGLTPKEAKSIGKFMKENPDFIAAPTEAALDLMRSVKGVTEWIESLLKDEPAKGKKAPAKSKLNTTKNDLDFMKFVDDHPDLSANQLLKEWRDKGGTMGRDRGSKFIRDVRGEERNKDKITRFRYYSNEDKPLFGKDSDKVLIKKGYLYLMQYDVAAADLADPITEWLYVNSEKKLTMRQLIKETKNAWGDGLLAGREKYKAKRLITESIELIHAIDNMTGKRM